MSFADQKYTDQAHKVADKAVERAFNVYWPALEHFTHMLEASLGYESAKSDLRENAADKSFLARFASLLYDASITEDALGRSYLVNKDLFFSRQSQRMPAKLFAGGLVFDGLDIGWFACKDEAVKISFDLVPERVVEYLRKKSFWISGIENDDLVKSIQEKLSQYAREGKTYEDFLREIQATFESAGVTPPAPYRIENVFRTNLYSAYSVAQLEQINQMQDRFPLWRYVAILDASTRPSHRALHDKLFPVGEGPYPPIDYNCRCTAQHLHTYQVDAEHLKPSDDVLIPPGVKKFYAQGEFEQYLARRQTSMEPSIRRSVQDSL